MGPVIVREAVDFVGHELNTKFRSILAMKTLALCRRFLASAQPTKGVAQKGASSWLKRRRPADSRLDPEKSIAEQFDLLRIVDNERYPAFFDYRGHRYKLLIEKER